MLIDLLYYTLHLCQWTIVWNCLNYTWRLVGLIFPTFWTILTLVGPKPQNLPPHRSEVFNCSTLWERAARSQPKQNNTWSWPKAEKVWRTFRQYWNSQFQSSHPIVFKNSSRELIDFWDLLDYTLRLFGVEETFNGLLGLKETFSGLLGLYLATFWTQGDF